MLREKELTSKTPLLELLDQIRNAIRMRHYSYKYVRYRFNDEKKIKITTVEVIVDEAVSRNRTSRIPKNKIMRLKVAPEEFYIRKTIKSVGGRWNPHIQLWELPYQHVEALGLHNRVVHHEK